jgi:hypothetical protein
MAFAAQRHSSSPYSARLTTQRIAKMKERPNSVPKLQVAARTKAHFEPLGSAEVAAPIECLKSSAMISSHLWAIEDLSAGDHGVVCGIGATRC